MKFKTSFSALCTSVLSRIPLSYSLRYPLSMVSSAALSMRVVNKETATSLRFPNLCEGDLDNVLSD